MQQADFGFSARVSPRIARIGDTRLARRRAANQPWRSGLATAQAVVLLVGRVTGLGLWLAGVWVLLGVLVDPVA